MSYFDITITSTPQPNWIKIDFSASYNGMTSVEIRKEQIIAFWCGANMLEVPILQGKMWAISFDGFEGSHKVLSVDGTVPLNNNELCDLIRGLRP